MAQKLTNYQIVTENKLFKTHLTVQFPNFTSWQDYLKSMASTKNENQWNQDALQITEAIQQNIQETRNICTTYMNTFKKQNSEPALLATKSDITAPLEKSNSRGVNVIGLKTLQQYAKLNYLATIYYAYEYNEALVAKPTFKDPQLDTETNLKQEEVVNKAAENQYLKIDTLYKPLVTSLQIKYQEICEEINQIVSANLDTSNFTSQQEEDLASLIDQINHVGTNEEEILDMNINKEKMENKRQSSANNVVIYKGTLGEMQKFWKENAKFCEVFLAFFFSMVLPVYIAPMITYSHSRIDTMLGISIPMAFLLGIATGGNDISNSQGPVYGSKTLTMPWVLFLGSLFNFLGALTLGDKVSKTISSKILQMDEFEGKEYEYALSMLAVLGSSTFSCMTITVFGIPISITKDVIFSLASVGLCAVGWAGISGSGILKVSLAMLTSPLVGTIVAVMMNGCMCYFVIKSGNPIARSRASLPIFGFFNIFFIVFLTCLKGFKVKPIYWCAVIGSGCGLLCAIVLLIYTTKKKISKDSDDKYNTGQKFREAYNDDQIAVIFKPLLIISACAMAFTHGANDVGNSIGPLVGILNVYHGRGVEDVEIPFWTLVMGGIAFSIGISTMGHRTIKTMGEKVTTLNPMKACTIQMGAACAILTATVLEMPVSTSHCAVGAVLGSTLAERVFGMPYFFKKGMFAKIAGSWFYTIPLGIALTVYFFYGVRGAFI